MNSNNSRGQMYSRLGCFPHSAASSSSSSCPSPAPAPASASTPPLPSPASCHTSNVVLARDTGLSLLKLQAAQRQHALRLRNFPPLSPQESSTLSFSDSTGSSPFVRVESCRASQSREPSCVQSHHQPISPLFKHGELYSANSNSPTSAYHALPLTQKASNSYPYKDAVPVVCGPSSTQTPLHNPKLNRQVSEDGCASADAKRQKRSLEDLEKELLTDDFDMSSASFFSDVANSSFLSTIATNSAMPTACDTPSGMAEPATDERDWTDAIEDFLSGDSSSPTTTMEQSTITSITSTTPTTMLHSKGSMCNPKELLLACADAINNDDLAAAQMSLSGLEQYVSIYGDPMQRVAAHMAEALAARLELIKAGKSDRLVKLMRDASPIEILQSTQVLYQACLHFKFGYLAANAAIAEACRNERNIHIIDFNIGQGNQWQTLIMGAFSQRHGGPPNVRITGISDPSSPVATVGVVQRLKEVARHAKVFLEFKLIQMEASLVEPCMLQRRAGEVVVVNLAFHLHKMADESVSTSNPRDSLLRKVRTLEPKIVTLVEHDAHTNTAPFYPRFVETLNYFHAIFESLDVASPARDSKDRVNAEKLCLARDMINIVACEGTDRLQRYEVAGKWRARMMMAGFRSVPMSPSTTKLVNDLLLPYSRKYMIREESGAVHLHWLDRSLVVASAWQ